MNPRRDYQSIAALIGFVCVMGAGVLISWSVLKSPNAIAQNPQSSNQTVSQAPVDNTDNPNNPTGNIDTIEAPPDSRVGGATGGYGTDDITGGRVGGATGGYGVTETPVGGRTGGATGGYGAEGVTGGATAGYEVNTPVSEPIANAGLGQPAGEYGATPVVEPAVAPAVEPVVEAPVDDVNAPVRALW